VKAGQLNAVSAGAIAVSGAMSGAMSGAAGSVSTSVLQSPSEADTPATDIKFCAIDDPDCEACQ
jgi:ribonucleoside-diphosphate reductase alpha chain